MQDAEDAAVVVAVAPAPVLANTEPPPSKGSTPAAAIAVGAAVAVLVAVGGFIAIALLLWHRLGRRHAHERAKLVAPELINADVVNTASESVPDQSCSSRRGPQGVMLASHWGPPAEQAAHLSAGEADKVRSSQHYVARRPLGGSITIVRVL